MPTLLDTRLRNHHRVQPNHANNYETLHGGILMKWMDELGAMSAMRFAGETCVTASVDGLDFRRPVPLGNTAIVEAYAYGAGESSVRVHVRASREAPRTREREVTTESRFTFVAVDADGSPVGVPELEVGSEEGRELREQALAAEG